MLSAYPASPRPNTPDAAAAHVPTWIDLFDPTEAEIAFVQDTTGLRVPTRGDISEIESTSRLYVERGALYLSTPLLTRPEAGGGGLTPGGFVLTAATLVTIRYERVGAFETVTKALHDVPNACSADVFTRVLEAVVDRAADLLEHVGGELDALSQDTFKTPERRPQRAPENPLREKLRLLGRLGDRLSQVRDALLGVGRIAPFVAETVKAWIPPEVQTRLAAVRQDIVSLNDYEAHLSAKVQFLLDAVLGFISIEQNDVVKVLTIASIVGVPPVLIAGIYGMNFKIIPELSWRYGYPYALVLMLVSAVLPLIWFRRRGWM